tara:strand:- start:80 stop:448 length:369 start_codon:yes stop_codon:yes gene_type:complete
MSMEPIQRRMSITAVPTALNVQQFMTDDISTLNFIQLSRGNTLLDMYNDPQPTARTYTNELFKNSISTGRNFFSTSMNTASAGRAAIGPIRLAPGQLQLSSAQTAGVLAIDNSVVLKFANGF